MALLEAEKIHWIDQVWNTFTELLRNEKCQNADKELLILSDELVRGFRAMTRELAKVNSAAVSEFYDWALSSIDSFDGLFQSDPKTFVDMPWTLLNQVHSLIPYKFIEYFFHASKGLYFENDFIRADRAFRFLTLLYPQNSLFWTWLGFNQQARKLPELAIISYTLASKLNPEKPELLFYIAECWVLLKKWDLASSYVNKCLSMVHEDARARVLKSKCEELIALIQALAAGADPNRVSLEAVVLFTGTAKEPADAIKAIQSGEQKPTQKILSSEETKEMFAAFNKAILELAKELGAVKQNFNRRLSGLGFFEHNSFQFTVEGLEIPAETLSKSCTLACCIFLGTLVLGIELSAEHKELYNVLKASRPVKISHSLAEILDQCRTPVSDEIRKYHYYYNARYDMVVSQEVVDPDFGSTNFRYQDNNKDDSISRAALILQDDIVRKSLLDLGCNDGLFLFACRNRGAGTITGVDNNAWNIDQAKDTAKSNKIEDAHFLAGDIENKAFLSCLPKADTVFLLEHFESTNFINRAAVLANLSHFAKVAFYYQGYISNGSHVLRMYELFMGTDFTRFEFLGRNEGRFLIRCGRELLQASDLPPNAVTSDSSDYELTNAAQIYVFTDTPRNPPFSSKCMLIQFVKR